MDNRSQQTRLILDRKIRYVVGGFFAFLFCSLLASMIAFSQPAGAVQTVPYKMNFQGNLTNPGGTAMADGQYNMKFRLFSGSSGGSAVWTEVRETTTRVTLSGGYFNVQLGDATALSPSLFTSQPLYLEVELPTPASATCATSGCAVYTEGAMTPRQPLGASPYAMNADTLDGYDSSSFIIASQNNTYTGTNLFQNTSDSNNAFQIATTAGSSLFIADTTNSRIQIGSSTADSTAVVLVLDTKNTGGDPAGVNGAMYYNSSLGKFRCYENGAWINCVGRGATMSVVGDVVNNNATPNTLQDVTGLSFAVVAGQTYRFSALINYTSAISTTGSRWTVTGPASPTLLSYTSQNTLTASTLTVAYGATYDSPTASNATSLTTGNVAKIDGVITPSSSGTVKIQFASEVASSAITAKAGSTLTWW